MAAIKEFNLLILSDLYIIVGWNKYCLSFYINRNNQVLCYLFWFRFTFCYFLKSRPIRFFFLNYMLRNYTLKYCYEIPYQCIVHLSSRLIHCGVVIVHILQIIGRDANLIIDFVVERIKRKGKSIKASLGKGVYIDVISAFIGRIILIYDGMVPNVFIKFDLPLYSICFENPVKVVDKKYLTKF